MASAPTLDLTVNFVFAKTPVFAQPDTGQPLDAALARSSIDPGAMPVLLTRGNRHQRPKVPRRLH
jgi:hypothetical protein